MIATAVILWSACLLRAGAETPVSPPALQALFALDVDSAAAPIGRLRDASDRPEALRVGDFADDEDDSDDDEPDAWFASPIAPLAVASTRSLLGWLPRHGFFRTTGRSPVLRC